jgi:AraC-like DNA-binding protein
MLFWLLCWGRFCCDEAYNVQRRSYDSYLLIYVKKGELMADAEELRKCVREGHIALMNCHKPHRYYAQGACELMWIHFDGSLAGKYYETIKKAGGSMDFVVGPTLVERLFASLDKPGSVGSTAYEAVISKNIVCVLTEMMVCRDGESAGNRTIGLIEDMKDYISAHLSENLSVKSLSKRASVSESYLMRIFKQKTDVTLHAYIMDARLSMAKYLLKTTDLSLKEIVSLTGFGSESYFTTAFKSKFFQSPNSYRKSDDIWGAGAP